MFVSDWMTQKVYTLTPETSLLKATTLMKEHLINHIPIIDKTLLVGMVSEKDIKNFILSKVTTSIGYDSHIIARIPVSDIMQKNVATVPPHTPIEEAAMIMHDNHINCLPVMMDEHLVGIISDADIYRVFVDITGIRNGGHRICLIIEDKPGSIKDVADVIRTYGFRLQSILTSYEGLETGYRRLVIRTKGKGNFSGLKDNLTKTFEGSKEIDIMEGL
jgi:acetoin utilization protein AcuB